MAGELVGTRPLAVDRLKGIFFPNFPIVSMGNEPLRGLIRLNEREAIHALYSPSKDGYQQSMNCRVNRDSYTIMEFQIGKNGLEEIWFGKMAIYLRGDSGPIELLTLREGIHVTSREPSGAYTVNKDRRKDFEALGDRLSDWVDKAKRLGRIQALPFQVSSSLQIGQV